MMIILIKFQTLFLTTRDGVNLALFVLGCKPQTVFNMAPSHVFSERIGHSETHVTWITVTKSFGDSWRFLRRAREIWKG